MSHFITEFRRGQEGKNKGLSMGKYLEVIARKTGGILKGMIYAIGAAPKVKRKSVYL